MKLNIPFEDLNKFRVSAVTLFCDAVLDYPYLRGENPGIHAGVETSLTSS